MSSKPKQERVKRQDATRKEQGAHAVSGKNTLPLNQTEGSPRHSGRAIPAPTPNSALNDEVGNLAPSGGKKK